MRGQTKKSSLSSSSLISPPASLRYCTSSLLQLLLPTSAMMPSTQMLSASSAIVAHLLLLVPLTIALSVWDSVIGTDQRMALHRYASKAGLEHKCFSRPLAPSNGNNIIELTLDAILTEIESKDINMQGKQQYVEYWTRQEWRHIEAHSDVDEALAKLHDQNPSLLVHDELESQFSTTYSNTHGFRFPSYGHVLYLQVGSEVKGPTCIFPGRSSGGDLLQSNKHQEDACATDDIHQGNGDIKLITVPAVSGRLLRFDGRDLHAVPRPHDLWMLPFVKGGAEYKPEEVWGRSVILFNVWPGEEDPPLDVSLDTNEGGEETHAAELCNAFSEWDEVDVVQNTKAELPDTQESNQSVKVWLLGNERRRGYPMRTANLLSPEHGGRESLRKALSEKSMVTELLLRQQ
jgi:hypothetical protein